MYDKFLAPLELYKWKCLCLSFTMSWSCQISWPFKSKSSYQFFSWSAWIFQYITNYNKFIKSSKSSSSKFDFLHKIVKKYDIRYDFWGKSTHCMTFRSKVWRLPKSMTTPNTCVWYIWQQDIWSERRTSHHSGMTKLMKMPEISETFSMLKCNCH